MKKFLAGLLLAVGLFGCADSGVTFKKIEWHIETTLPDGLTVIYVTENKPQVGHNYVSFVDKYANREIVLVNQAVFIESVEL